MKIHELLCDESQWCKDAEALDAAGKRLDATDDNAICWCVRGAAEVCYPEVSERDQILDRLITYLKVSGRAVPLEECDCIIIEWNDRTSTSFVEVRAVLLELDL